MDLGQLTTLDLTIAYAMALSGRGKGVASFGRTQLVKLVYLADLAHAVRSGTTYTGTPWTFFHYGPYAPVVADRIPDVADAIGARTFLWSVADEDESRERYAGDDVQLPGEVVKRIPVVVRQALDSIVKRVGGDTHELLQLAYLSLPMRSAGPGDLLDFRLAAQAAQTPEAPASNPGTERQRRQFRQRMQDRLLAAREAGAREKMVVVAPLYGERFAEATAWLDGMAGDQLETHEGTVEFSNELWTSDLRQP